LQPSRQAWLGPDKTRQIEKENGDQKINQTEMRSRRGGKKRHIFGTRKSSINKLQRANRFKNEKKTQVMSERFCSTKITRMYFQFLKMNLKDPGWGKVRGIKAKQNLPTWRVENVEKLQQPNRKVRAVKFWGGHKIPRKSP